jgi:hypothetical protein
MPNHRANVIRFPQACPKCGAVAAMPAKAGTLSERRTQVDLLCARCRHEWPLEMTPPVLIVNPDRETDDAVIAEPPPIAPRTEPGDRRARGRSDRSSQRMRVGLRGLLRSGDRMHTIAVLYSLDRDGRTGRLRPVDPNSPWPHWLREASRVWLSGEERLLLRARITAIKAPTLAEPDEDHFSEFVVHR